MCQLLVSCVGFLFDLLALLACWGAFCIPFWVHCPNGCSGVTNGDAFEYEGMLVRMTFEKYWKYFWEDDFKMEQDLPDWYKASQALYTFGFVILLSTVLLSLMHVMCRCCCHKAFSLSTVIGSLIFSAFILIGAAVGVFIGFQYKENNVQIVGEKSVRHFYYALYASVGGLLCALLSSILFLADGCQSPVPYDGYQTARMI